MSRVPIVSIVLVSYNSKELLSSALTSIEEHADLEYEIIVVDNNSTDDVGDFIKKEYPKVNFIQSKENVGYAAGNNLGMKEARGDYIFLLNTDAEFVDKHTLSTLVHHMELFPKVAIISPKVVLPSGAMDMASHRGFPTPWNAISYFTGLEKTLGSIPVVGRLFGGYHQTWQKMDRLHEIDVCTGAAMLVRASAMESVGLFDERFFMYAEDIDWCYRFRKKGWIILFDPSIRVLHRKSQTGLHKKTETKEDETVKVRTRAHFFDTMTQFYDKHYLASYPALVRTLVHLGIKGIRILKGAHNASKNTSTTTGRES
jgi:GT2 family glycosyltransferase